MKPRMLKMTNPAKTEVEQLAMEMIMASLVKKKQCLIALSAVPNYTLAKKGPSPSELGHGSLENSHRAAHKNVTGIIDKPLTLSFIIKKSIKI